MTAVLTSKDKSRYRKTWGLSAECLWCSSVRLQFRQPQDRQAGIAMRVSVCPTLPGLLRPARQYTWNVSNRRRETNNHPSICLSACLSINQQRLVRRLDLDKLSYPRARCVGWVRSRPPSTIPPARVSWHACALSVLCNALVYTAL
ncbi:hypothetical protein LY76DRAFT_58824 [Colletotrichum caudatum]|nr:hypothetical protein LY76DRAFT_58824 [Colletotrichum caudatum]